MRNLLRYDAAIGDFGLAASLGNRSKVEAAALYKADKLQVKLGLWDQRDSGAGNSDCALSASGDGDSGFNFTGAYGTDDRDGDSRLYQSQPGDQGGLSACCGQADVCFLSRS